MPTDSAPVEGAPDPIEIPSDLAELSSADLAELRTRTVEAFDAIRSGDTLTGEDLDTLTALTEVVEALTAEQASRAAADAERAGAAAALAARVHTEPADTADDEDAADGDSPESGDGDDVDDSGAVPSSEATESGEGTPVTTEASEADSGQPRAAEEALAAGARPRPTTIRLGANAARRAVPPPAAAPATMRDIVMASGDGLPVAPGTGMDWDQVGRAIDRRLAVAPTAQIDAARRSGRDFSQRLGVFTVTKPVDPGLVIDTGDAQEIDRVLSAAASETRLPGGSLVASGGWCAPSEVTYDGLLELESRDGIIDLPTVQVRRGGISFTNGPDFASIYADAPGWHYTEAQDAAGTYAVDADGIGTGAAGTKPCYTIPCPDWSEVRLDVDGVCVSAGLLQSRGYPEMIARTTRGVLVAHEHRMAGRTLAAMVTGSTAVAMSTGQVGTAAPLLSALEKQIEHMRYVHRTARSRTVEIVLPFWARGAIRSDLSLRSGVDMLSVTDAQISAWFGLRGAVAQFVYNWQDLTGGAATMVDWPTSVVFLAYFGGTWIEGTSDILTVDTLYDSALLAENDYTALWTEEGRLLLKRGHDSRAVTVPILTNGGTGLGQVLDHSGAPAV